MQCNLELKKSDHAVYSLGKLVLGYHLKLTIDRSREGNQTTLWVPEPNYTDRKKSEQTK